MIDPNLLTKEAGFVEGEDLKIRHRHSDGDFDVLGKLIKITSRGMVLEVPLAGKGGITVLFSDILDVRPLTGPMAIWNFLPKNIKAVMLDDDGWPWSQYFDTTPDLIIPRGAIFRPFWAKGKASE